MQHLARDIFYGVIEAFRNHSYVPYSSFALEHRLAHSVHVYITLLGWPRAGSTESQRSFGSFPPFLHAFASSRSLHPSSPFKRLARSPLISHTHTLSLSPAGGRAINNRLSPPLFNLILSGLSLPFELTRGPSVCDTQVKIRFQLECRQGVCLVGDSDGADIGRFRPRCGQRGLGRLLPPVSPIIFIRTNHVKFSKITRMNQDAMFQISPTPATTAGSTSSIPTVRYHAKD